MKPAAILITLLFAACVQDQQAAPPAETPAAQLEWRSLADMPTPRTEVAGAVSGERIYIAGGYAPGGATVDTVEVFDTQSGTWETGPALPVAVNHASATSVNDEIYVIGGYEGTGQGTAKGFVFRGNTWEPIADMPESRGAAGAAAVDGRIYVAGGVGPNGIARDMFVFDTNTNSWSRLPGPPTPREHLAVAAFENAVYVLGGRTGGIGTNLAAAERFDVATQEWSRLPDLPTARGGIAGTATGNGFVIAVGGEAEATFDEAEAFDVRENKWISLPKLPTARHGLAVVVIGTTMYVIAGGPTPGLDFSGANEVIDLGPLR